MTDEKKLPNEQITDEQANEAAGGIGLCFDFKCDGCGRFFTGSLRFNVGNKVYCQNCFTQNQQQQGYSNKPQERLEEFI